MTTQTVQESPVLGGGAALPSEPSSPGDFSFTECWSLLKSRVASPHELDAGKTDKGIVHPILQRQFYGRIAIPLGDTHVVDYFKIAVMRPWVGARNSANHFNFMPRLAASTCQMRTSRGTISEPDLSGIQFPNRYGLNPVRFTNSGGHSSTGERQSTLEVNGRFDSSPATEFNFLSPLSGGPRLGPWSNPMPTEWRVTNYTAQLLWH